MNKTLCSIAMLACVLGFAPNASAVILNFDSLSAPQAYNVLDGAYTSSGFSVSAPDGVLAYWGPDGAGAVNYVPGHVMLFNDGFAGFNTTVLQRLDGGVFALDAIDLAQSGAFANETTVTFLGTILGGGTATETFTLTEALGTDVRHFTFDSSFDRVTSVSWLNDAEFHQFNNIEAAPVPEPGTFALFGLGLFGLACLRKKRSA
jgi:hypothetical protein